MRARTRVTAQVAGLVAAMMLVMPAAPAIAAPPVMHASLAGGSEVPGPGDADGSGIAKIRINMKRQSVCFLLVVKDMALPATAAHIHAGATGVAGDIVVTLGTPTEVGSSGFGLATGCARDQARSLLRGISSRPGDYYVNVHNAEFPGGAVRGQLEVVTSGGGGGGDGGGGGGGGGPY
jgi:hypothetical protein